MPRAVRPRHRPRPCAHSPRAALLAALAAVSLLPCAAPAQARDSVRAAPRPSPAAATMAILPVPAANPADVASMDAIIAALYEVISGPAGARRNWDRMRSLFVPGARLIPVRVGPDGSASAVMISVEEYIGRIGPRLEQEGFFEREVARRTEAFGNVAHAFSTYESRRTPQDAAPFTRGINSIQLLKDGGRWWVVNVFWDSERPGNPIPPAYLQER